MKLCTRARTHTHTHTHTEGESAEKRLPARPPRRRPPRPWEDACCQGSLAGTQHGGVAHGGLRAAVQGHSGCPVPQGPSQPTPPLPGLLRPGHPSGRPDASSPGAASSLLPSLLQLLYRLIRIRHHCFSHLLVSCLPLPLETELPAGSRLGRFCSQLSLRPSGCLAHRTCSGVFVEGTCDPT